jgi:acetyltransferase-like isoleucine patch superfamily enzyme
MKKVKQYNFNGRDLFIQFVTDCSYFEHCKITNANGISLGNNFNTEQILLRLQFIFQYVHT